MSQGSGRNARLVLRDGAEALWLGHKGPVQFTDFVGVWGAVEGLRGAHERARSLCPGGQGVYLPVFGVCPRLGKYCVIKVRGQRGQEVRAGNWGPAAGKQMAVVLLWART